MISDSAETPSGSSDADAEFLPLASYVFREMYLDARNISLERASEADFQDFIRWSSEELDLSSLEIQGLCEKLQISPRAYDQLKLLTTDPTSARYLAEAWPQIVLSCRGEPVNRVASLHVVCLIKWEDGKVVPLSLFVPAELNTTGSVFTDSNVYALLQVSAYNLLEILFNTSLDSLHDNKSCDADDAAYEALMGLIFKLLRGARVIDSPETAEVQSDTQLNEPSSLNGATLPPQMRDRCQDVMRVLQFLFRPPIPSQVKQRLLARQRQQLTQKPSQGPVQGGWDS